MTFVFFNNLWSSTIASVKIDELQEADSLHLAGYRNLTIATVEFTSRQPMRGLPSVSSSISKLSDHWLTIDFTE
ncbi:hypothetical protein KIN20_025067 [Parelaphostrongylus tenuis]|uniref:Uncharacterized protein n=1 Tax=Parelaphostrongylus tenuis TaxID=148309 RepID=A0AAD5MZ15_PARTN|nr:hypothetical protein KIN20_025067 [Parelaphostrongylus tenuis]